MNNGLTSMQTVLTVTFFVTLLASLGMDGSTNTSHMSRQTVLNGNRQYQHTLNRRVEVKFLFVKLHSEIADLIKL